MHDLERPTRVHVLQVAGAGAVGAGLQQRAGSAPREIEPGAGRLRPRLRAVPAQRREAGGRRHEGVVDCQTAWYTFCRFSNALAYSVTLSMVCQTPFYALILQYSYTVSNALTYTT